MSEPPPTCATCKAMFVLPDQPKYLRCRKSGASPDADASLCGEMRASGGKCGPAGKLWEDGDG